MSLFDLVPMIMSNLWRRKIRSAVTVLAVVIGATLLTLMVSLGTGLHEFITDQFGIMIPEETLTVATGDRYLDYRNAPPSEMSNIDEKTQVPFTSQDIEYIRAIDGVERIDYPVQVSTIHVSPADNGKTYSGFVNALPDYEVKMRQLLTGNHFDGEATGECLIAYEYLEAFDWSHAEAALGKEIFVTTEQTQSAKHKDYPFTVVGVTQSTINATEILIPIDDAIEMERQRTNNHALYSNEQPGYLLHVKASDKESIPPIIQSLEELGFKTQSSKWSLEKIDSRFFIVKLALNTFGFIALIVAAICIINTLTLATYERTREVGIMKAIGATRNTIRLLFAAEGGALGLLGGILGVAFGFGLGIAINVIASNTFMVEFPSFGLSVFPPWLIPMVIVLTTIVGFVAGMYPANHAARLNPVEALRHE